MPENTRPRIVDIPSTYSTPGFNPNAPDPRELLANILQPAQQPVQQNPGVLSTILNSLANGIAVGTSASPGDALRQQLAQKSQQEFERQQAQQQYDQRVALMGKEFGLREVGNQLEDQRQIGKEQRDDVRYQTRRKDALDDYIAKNNIDVQATDARDKKQFKYRKAEAILDHNFRLKYQDRIDARSEQTNQRLENKELFDKKISLISAGVPAGKANSIANKMFNGEALSPEEANTITAAARRQIALASGGGRSRSGSGGSSSGGGLSAKQMFQYMNTRMKDQFVVVKTPDGEQVVEMSNAPKDTLTGEIQGFVRIANAGEKMAKLSEEVSSIEALLTPQEKAKAGNAPPKSKIPGAADSPYFGPEIPPELLNSNAITPEQKASEYYKQEYKRIVSAGISPDLAKRMLRDTVKKEAPQDILILDGIFGTEKKTLRAGKNLDAIKKSSAGKIY